MEPKIRDRVIEQELLAHLNVQHFRGLKLACLRLLAASSLPIWVEAHWSVLPGLLAWLAVLAEGYCVAMSAAYAALECIWAHRAAQVEAGSSGDMIHTVWTVWDELRTALWYGIAVVSLVPWIYVAVDRPLAAPLLSALTATAWTVLLLLAAAETLAPLRRFHGPDAGAAGLDGPQLTWLGRGRPAG